LTGLADHLWQSLLCCMLIAALAWLTRRNSAPVRLWLWRIAAVKLLLPFSLLTGVGRWYGFPARFPGDPPPDVLVKLVADVSPWFTTGHWFASSAARVVLLLALSLSAVMAGRWIFWRIHREALRARIEEWRLESDPDDREPSMGFFRAALFTACAMIVAALPLLGGAIRGSAHAHRLLLANTASMNEASVTMRPAQPGMGTRYFIEARADGVRIRNVTVRELTAIAYGVNRFFVRGDHFRENDDEDWLIDSRHDVHIAGRVLEPDDFDSYALRHVITRTLSLGFGMEIYVNNQCQDPCGRWSQLVLPAEVVSASQPGQDRPRPGESGPGNSPEMNARRR
jgi:hypothetical protein